MEGYSLETFSTDTNTATITATNTATATTTETGYDCKCDYFQLWLRLLATATTSTCDYFQRMFRGMLELWNFNVWKIKQHLYVRCFDTLMKLWFWNGEYRQTWKFGDKKRIVEIALQKKDFPKKQFLNEN